jgi:hypothetical protein
MMMRVADGDGVQMDGRWKTLLRPRGFRLRHYTLHRDYAGPPPKECEGRQKTIDERKLLIADFGLRIENARR